MLIFVYLFNMSLLCLEIDSANTLNLVTSLHFLMIKKNAKEKLRSLKEEIVFHFP
jgi:hypothetical protein